MELLKLLLDMPGNKDYGVIIQRSNHSRGLTIYLPTGCEMIPWPEDENGWEAMAAKIGEVLQNNTEPLDEPSTGL